MKQLAVLLFHLLCACLSAQQIDSSLISKLDSLIAVASELSDSNKIEKALEINSVAEKIANDKIGVNSAIYGRVFCNYGYIYFKAKDFDNSEKHYLKALDLVIKTLGKEDTVYEHTIRNLALVYDYKEKYKEEEQYFLDDKIFWEKRTGKSSREYGNTLINLGMLYWKLCQYDKAEKLTLDGKIILENTIGKDNEDYATCLNNLAILFSDQKKFSQAEFYYIEAKNIRAKVLGTNHPDYVNSINNLAVLYQEQHMLEKAEPYYAEAKAIADNSSDKDDLSYSSLLSNYAFLCNELSLYEKSEPMIKQALEIIETRLGKDHPEYSPSLIILANLYEHQKKYSESDMTMNELSQIDQKQLLNSISFLSEQDLSQYLVNFNEDIKELNSYLLTREYNAVSAGELTSIAFQNALFYKGFLLNAAMRIHNLANHSERGTKVFKELKELRKQLAEQYSKPKTERANIQELEEQCNNKEKELSGTIADYNSINRVIKWQDLQRNLKESQAIIEFINFQRRFPKTDDSLKYYAALVLKSGKEPPRYITLFDERALDSLLHSKSQRKADYVNNLYSLSSRGAVELESPKRSLYDIVWKNLEQQLNGIKTIYFSPSGLLHRINLDAIPVSETETLADKYQLIELNSSRQLAISDTSSYHNNDALLYGGIQFDRDSNAIQNENLVASRSIQEFSFQAVDSTLRGGQWTFLPGTEREINAIEKTMQANGFRVIAKKGYEATEDYFKQLNERGKASPRIIHIATHGYFFPDPKQKEGSGQLVSGNEQKESVFKINEHPMLRSGLILAGGNTTWQGKPVAEGAEDGILTAYEISQMNLSNTELVVLSACETGLGDIQSNEGVYGLQRAFKIAGVKYMIMSLWQVPDKQTSLLMTSFYKKWLEVEDPAESGKKMTIPNAFHAAQKELRDQGLDPYQWAGFVLLE